MKVELSDGAKELVWAITNAIPPEISVKLTDNELKSLITSIRLAIINL